MLSIDIETLGTESNAKIVSIGAVAHTFTHMHDRLYLLVNPSQTHRTVDLDTCAWWLTLPETVQNALIDKPRYSLHGALEMLSKFCGVYGAPTITRDPDFDIRILRHAFDQCGIDIPWKYNDHISVRTLDLFAHDEVVSHMLHNALADAECNAQLFINVCKENPSLIEGVTRRWPTVK